MATVTIREAHSTANRPLCEAVKADMIGSLAALADAGRDIGITIRDVNLLKTGPPPQVQREFDSVTKAAQVADRLQREAETEAQDILAQATSWGEEQINLAKEYKSRLVNEAEADAKYINTLLEQYPDDPEKLSHLLEQRRLEVIQSVLEEADETFVTSLGDGDGKREVRVWVNRDPQTRRENIRRKKRESEKKKPDTIEGL